MKNLILVVIVLLSLMRPALAQKTVILSKSTLQDKIRGGWAGQVIGVTYGGPTEFQFKGTMVNAYQPIAWYDGYIKNTMINNAGLYDDLYMDLTFVDVFEKEGLDAPASSHAKAYANAGYMLWHANQSGRYNILHGIAAPKSGHWLNNPHADDIDFQIEADFSGLMSPGMPNTAVEIGDPIGHIMNFGDGWYGGAYIGAMYSLAFVSNDLNSIVREALQTIPPQSDFYKCIADVIQWHDQFPSDWRRTWFELEKKWADEVGCPDGVFHSFNIDAKINAAYVVLGLLYGEGDFTKTMDVTTHAGQDSDCNPSSAGGILGTVLGYDKIPPYWKMGLKEAEDIDFKYTTISLNKVYQMGYKHALQVIERNGGKIQGDDVLIAKQSPKVVRFEKSFADHYPTETRSVDQALSNEFTSEFDGTGFVLLGEARPKHEGVWNNASGFVFKADVYIDGQKTETVDLPVSYTHRRNDLFWKYQLPKGKHTVRVKLLNPDENNTLYMQSILVYSDQPRKK